MTEVTIRSADDWDEVYRTAVAAGRTFSGRKPEGSFFPARTVSAPGLALDNTFVLYEGETLVSALQAYDRRMTVGGVPVPVAALGNVFTVPEYQGRGYGSRLLEHVRNRLAEKGYAASILLTGTPSFYEQHGWRELPFTTRICTDPVRVSVRSDDPWIAFDLDDHLGALQMIYRHTRQFQDGRLLRPEVLWRQWVFGSETEVLSPEQIRLYRRDGTVEGYFVFSGGERVTCHEVGYVGDDVETFLLDVWNALCARSNGAVEWIPPRIERVVEELEAAGCTFEERNESECLLQVHDADLLSAISAESVAATSDLRRHIVAEGDWYWSPVDSF